MKHSYIFRLLSLLLVAVLLFSCAACEEQKPADNSSDVTSSEKEPSDNTTSSDFEITDNDDSVELSDNDSSKSESDDEAVEVDDGSPTAEKYKNSKKISLLDYSVVYDNELSVEGERNAYKLRRALYKVAGEYPEYNSEADVPAASAAKKEILVGTTDRAESEKSVTALRANRSNCFYDYIIKVYGDKVVINALSEDVLEDAIDFFADTFLSGEGEAVIPANYSFIYAEQVETAMSIGGTDVSKYVIACGAAPARMLYKGCEELQSVIEDKTDYIVPIVKDKDSSVYDNRILVSITDSDLNSYSIAVKGKDIVITAGHSYSANAALHALASNIKVVKDGYSFNIPKNYTYNGTYSDKTVNTDSYHLAYSDEFGGNTLDSDLWRVEGLSSPDDADYSKVGYPAYVEGDYANNLISNVKVESGNLNMLACKTAIDSERTAWWGSQIHSNVWFQYGLFEIRAKVNKGKGFWPAFWALGEKTLEHNYDPEVDVFEFFGNDKTCASQLHSWWTAGRYVRGLSATDSQIEAGHIQHLGSADGNSVKLPGGESYADEYHTFACEWTPKFIEFSMDGEVYCTVPLTSFLTDPTYGYSVNEYMLFLQTPMHIILATSVGRDQAGLPDENTVLPNAFEIDYVHLYKQDGVGTFEIR